MPSVLLGLSWEPRCATRICSTFAEEHCSLPFHSAEAAYKCYFFSSTYITDKDLEEKKRQQAYYRLSLFCYCNVFILASSNSYVTLSISPV